MYATVNKNPVRNWGVRKWDVRKCAAPISIVCINNKVCTKIFKCTTY